MNRRELLQRMALLGAGTLTASVANALLAGVPLHTGPAAPVFSKEQSALIAQLAERIIPTTDTPGAIAAGVPAFIERMASEWYTANERKIFNEGLAAFDLYCRRQYACAGRLCEPEQLDAALRHFEALASEYHSPVAGIAAMFGGAVDENTPFFTKFKELTVLGYYTSEVGATQELRYDPMPMRYDGDVKFGPDDRAWSAGGLVR